MRQATIARGVAASVMLLCAVTPVGGGSDSTWQPGFHLPGTDGIPYVMTVFDDGTGPALYVGGRFKNAGDVAASCIAKWDGQHWSGLGSGLDPTDPYADANAMVVFDDGTGPALYVGGSFTVAGGIPALRVARWDGTQWSSLGSGVQGNWWVNALEVLDDGSGPALFVGGQFSHAGGIECNGIAKWDGAGWASLGGGVEAPSFGAEVLSLKVFDDGNGPALFVGGDFLTADDGVAPGIARWNATGWSSLGDGLFFEGKPIGWARAVALAVAAPAPGDTQVLYVGGYFTHAGGIPAQGFATWDGSKWSTVDFSGGEFVLYNVTELRPIDLGDGPELWGIGSLDPWPAPTVSPPARLKRGTWSVFNPPGMFADLPWTELPSLRSIEAFDDGTGTRLYLCGKFAQIGGVGAQGVAAWDGREWSSLGGGSGFSDLVLSLTSVAGPTMTRIFAGGWFVSAGSTSATSIAEWDGAQWHGLGAGMASVVPLSIGSVDAVVGAETDSSLSLFAGGNFNHAGGVPVNNIARWDGTQWHPLGLGVQDCDLPKCMPYVYDLLLRPAATGVDLLVAGQFNLAGGILTSNIARWDGQNWSGLGSGMNGTVRALTLFDGVGFGGPVIIAAGMFSQAGGAAANNIASWDGSQWHSLGAGTNNIVHALVSIDSATPGGPGLIAGGKFTQAGGLACHHVARWDGSQWSNLGTGLGIGTTSHYVNALAVAHLDNLPRLVAGGRFPSVSGGPTLNNIAQWDGIQWLAIEGGVLADPNFSSEGSVFAMVSVPDGPAPGLWVGGFFQNAGTLKSQYVARWGPPVLSGDLNDDGDIDSFDLALLLAAWGPCPARDGCSGDMNDDGVVNGFDLAILLGSWT